MRSHAQDHRTRTLQTEARKDPLPSSHFALPAPPDWGGNPGWEETLGVLEDGPGPTPSTLILCTLCCFCPLNLCLVGAAGWLPRQPISGRPHLPQRATSSPEDTQCMQDRLPAASPCRRALLLQASGPFSAAPSFSLVCGPSCADNPVH